MKMCGVPEALRSQNIGLTGETSRSRRNDDEDGNIKPPMTMRLDFIGALRAAAWTGLLALVLFLPLIGFKTVQNIRNELVLETRWPLLFALSAVLAALRFLYALVIGPWLASRARRPAAVDPANVARRARLAGWAGPFGIGFLVVYPALALAP